ncbi:aspartyl protease family protein [Iningainema tapete]|uniref:Aspartyl protease family protein n=1 Tax=Iningainema tapete BLCC-T55 TaxID=2748662 RepID=A0A8J7BYT7_9CYAN|nr:aspartyl protease family protein [Iningainema tapete]MBD2776327.1 aspartyl protease family protein [Iningainema tapete BLCC-T55]
MLAPHLLGELEIEALVDTGATYLVISEDIVKKLGLRIRDQQKAKYADGREGWVGVTEALLIECEGRQTTEDALVTGDVHEYVQHEDWLPRNICRTFQHIAEVSKLQQC